MRAVEKIALGIISVITLGACYVASVILGWVLAFLGTVAIVFTCLMGILYFIAYVIREIYYEVFPHRRENDSRE